MVKAVTVAVIAKDIVTRGAAAHDRDTKISSS
jgi:hypothetical protein